uniref:VP1 n=1 Tax=Foot-and-mouth disease virus serotype SAT-2 TaxID=35292 RepID=UPI0006B87EC3|nr:Chain 1, Vp1 [Foot-and-mouth disease virus SAT 2]
TTSSGEGADVVTTDPSTHGGAVTEKKRVHTDVAFVMDRFTHVLTNRTAFAVDLMDTNEKTLVGALLRAATYYFCDLEIACLGEHERVWWQPNGAPRTTTLRDNPMVFSHNNVTRFAVPYTAPHRLLSTRYNGECKYTQQSTAIRGDRAVLAAKYANTKHKLPSTFNFGYVTADKPVDVYYRMKRAELYCPRPLLPGYDHADRDRFDSPIGVEKQ